MVTVARYSSIKSHLGSKAWVLVVLLMSVFISSGIFVGSVHAQTLGVSLNPSTGYTCNPLANSGLFSFASGSSDSLTSTTQGIREAAVYGGNGNEPMATASASASGQATYEGGVWFDHPDVEQSEATITWPYIIMKDGAPLDSTYATGPIPLQISYRMSLSPSGDAAAALGIFSIWGPRGGSMVVRSRAEGIGLYSSSTGGDPAEGQIPYLLSFDSGSNSLTISVRAVVSAGAYPKGDLGRIYSWSEAQAVVDPYVSIDPSSPLASQLQVYNGINYTANSNDLSSWTPAVHTPVDFNNIIPISAGTEALAVRGDNNLIYDRMYNSTSPSWYGWNSLPTGTTIDSPAAAVVQNTLYTVVRGSDGTSLWFSSLNLVTSSFSGWTLLSGSTPSAPTLSSNNTALALVVRGGDNRIYYRIYNISSASWTGWSALPSGTTLDAPAASLVGDTLHVVVRGSNGASLWYSNINTTNQAFSGWSLLSGSTPSAPTLTSNGITLALVVRGSNNLIYYRFYTIASATWSGWSALPSGTTIDTPAATILQNSLIIVVRGSDGTSLWTSNINLATSAFSGWTLLSGSTPSKPTLTS